MTSSESEDYDTVSEKTRLMDGHVATNSSVNSLEVKNEIPRKRNRRLENYTGSQPETTADV